MINLLIGLLTHRSIEHSVLDQLIDDLSVQLLIKQFASTNSYNICIFYFFIIRMQKLFFFNFIVQDVRFKLCQAEKPSPIRDCDGIPLVGQGAVGHFPSCMI